MSTLHINQCYMTTEAETASLNSINMLQNFTKGDSDLASTLSKTQSQVQIQPGSALLTVAFLMKSRIADPTPAHRTRATSRSTSHKIHGS
jgi:hypothetical protein